MKGFVTFFAPLLFGVLFLEPALGATLLSDDRMDAVTAGGPTMQGSAVAFAQAAAEGGPDSDLSIITITLTNVEAYSDGETNTIVASSFAFASAGVQ